MPVAYIIIASIFSNSRPLRPIRHVLFVLSVTVVGTTVLVLLSSHPDYFGKRGMRYFNLRKNSFYCPTINLDKVWTLVSDQTREHYAKSDKLAPVIDVSKAVR